jgi:hypothetical protein
MNIGDNFERRQSVARLFILVILCFDRGCSLKFDVTDNIL